MNLILGISGSIAAFKAPELLRLFTGAGFRVKCVLTENGAMFAAKASLATLSGGPVYSSLFSGETYDPLHVSLSVWADAVVVAPATANILAKYRAGLADDLLSTLLLEFDKRIFFAPAMNTRMWTAWQTKENVAVISKRKNIVFVGPEKGALACGEEGQGRMASPQDIFRQVSAGLKK